MITDFSLTRHFDDKYNHFTYPSVMDNAEGLSARDAIHRICAKQINNLSVYLKVNAEDIINAIFSRFYKTACLCNVVDYTKVRHDSPCQQDNAIKVAENAFCRIEPNRTISGQLKAGFHEVYYDVYLVGNQYSDTFFSKIACELLKQKFPSLFDEKNTCMFNEPIYRFDEATREVLQKITNDTTLDTLAHDLVGVHNYSITLGDISHVINDREYINARFAESRVKIYYPYLEQFYINLGTEEVHDEGTAYYYKRSLTIPLEALFKKDWALIENLNIFDTYRRNGKPIKIEGLQKNMPYFKMPIVGKIKEVIMNC